LAETSDEGNHYAGNLYGRMDENTKDKDLWSLALINNKSVTKRDKEMSAAVRKNAPRLQPEDRRAMFLFEAASLFAAQGFTASTNDLAERMGVRKTLLYKYFPSKEGLIEEVLKAFLNTSWLSYFSDIVADRAIPLEERLIASFTSMLENEQEKSLRLLIRSMLDGIELPQGFFNEFDKKLILPIIIELRHIHNLTDIGSLPLMDSERELALGLYGSLFFYSIRRHIYKTQICDDQAALIKMYVAQFLMGTPKSLVAIHQSYA
jgi:AcrR family transcriptional regulator